MIGNGVTNIGIQAFGFCTSLTKIAIPDNVTSLGGGAFDTCTSLTNVIIGNGITGIDETTFEMCFRLVRILIGNHVTSIGNGAFAVCSNLTSITIPGTVTNLGISAFDSCTSLKSLFFQGNAPITNANVFAGDNSASIYYLPGTTGWSSSFAGRPTVLWNPQTSTSDPSFGIQTNEFGFTITGSSNLVIVVEACTNLASPVWSPVATNTLNTFVGTNGISYFSDSQWTNSPARLYRFRSP
jgi:hypothetical protein